MMQFLISAIKQNSEKNPFWYKSLKISKALIYLLVAFEYHEHLYVKLVFPLFETFGSDQYASQQIEKNPKQKQKNHETNFC